MSDDPQHEKSAEELERGESEAEHDGDSEPAFPVAEVLKRESDPLQEGDALDTPVGPLPVRSLIAMAAMLAVSVVVYLIAWALLGGIGLLLGWIPAAALGFLAAREVGRRS